MRERLDFSVAFDLYTESKQTSINALSKKTGRSRGGLVKMIDRIDWTGAFAQKLMLVVGKSNVLNMSEAQSKGFERAIHYWLYHSDFSMSDFSNKKLETLIKTIMTGLESGH